MPNDAVLENPTPPTLGDVLSRKELQTLRALSDARAAATFGFNWALIVAAFAMTIAMPNPFTILLAVLLLGGRQLGLAILMHDCSHRAFFRTRRLNDFVGHWLCAVPVKARLDDYRAVHLRHHRHAGTSADPDLVFVEKYPVPADSLRRKLIRDVTGQTGLRDLLAYLRRFRWSRDYGAVLFHLTMLFILTGFGAPWTYLLWWAADLFVFPVIVRIRQIGEHGVAMTRVDRGNRGDRDPRKNTSTTLPAWWERLLIAPNNVHYHLEHHLFATVPPYRLTRLHRLLKTRGFYDGYDCISKGYADVLRRAVQPVR